MPSYTDLGPTDSYVVSDTSVYSNIPFVFSTPTYEWKVTVSGFKQLSHWWI